MREIGKDEAVDLAICIDWIHKWSAEEICYDDDDDQVLVDHDAWNSKIENTIHRAFQQFADIAFRVGKQGRELNVTSIHLKTNHCPLPNHRDRGQLLVHFTAGKSSV